MFKRSTPIAPPQSAPTIAAGARVVFQPDALAALCRGADAIVATLRPTLGPLARTVVVERNAGRHFAPDILHDGGMIARRVIALGEPNADVGAMLLRHALWRLHERAGDAVATAAVLFQAIVKTARPFLAAGGDAMRLRNGLLAAADVAADALASQAVELDASGDALRRWLGAHCSDTALVAVIADQLIAHGADASLQVEIGRTTGIECEHIAGAFWKGGWHATPFPPEVTHSNPMFRIQDAHVFVSDLDLTDAAYLEPLIMAAARLRPTRLFVICRAASPQLVSLFTQARQKGIAEAVFVKPPSVSGPDRMAQLIDMAVLCGATFVPALESNKPGAVVDLASLLPGCLGRADAAWASSQFIGVEGGRGDRATQVAHLAKLDAALEAEQDAARVRFYQERLSLFGSGVVRLKVGAHTDSEQKQRQAQAERIVRMVTQAARYGVVDGAGSALVRAEKLVRAYAADQTDADLRFGAECLARALSAPAAAIAANAGIDAGAFVTRLRACKPGRGIDVTRDSEVDLRAAGILDSAYALDLAVRTAASAAATLLTTEVIVHRRQTDSAVKP